MAIFNNITNKVRDDLTKTIREDDLDIDEQNSTVFSVGKKVKIDLADMDFLTWRELLRKDRDTLMVLIALVSDIAPDHDSKLKELLRIISDKIEHPINPGNRKVLVFSAFSDTAEYLYENVSKYVMERHGLHTAMITGSVEGRSTIKRLNRSMNDILTCFSPVSKGRDVLFPGSTDEIDILIATDCISEGQNLQDCDYLINYDIHWNPVRIIQRFGRIDRIGSRNAQIQLVNFWPDLTLDDYINLKARVETRMKISVMTSTGDDDLINAEEKGDLEYRRQQLKRLQDEVVDIEDMSEGISIMDLGLNEFRLDLLDYVKRHDDLANKPHGMHAVVPADKNSPAGVIYVLKNCSNDINSDRQNPLHPFYLVYVSESGQIVINHLSPQKTLERIRLLCQGKYEPDLTLCKSFNLETDDGKNMEKYSKLLSIAIKSIIDVKEESIIDSLFKSGGTALLSENFRGIQDFELITFIVVR